MTGIGTLRDDDPRLTVRDVPAARQPLRIVVDSRLRISPEARIFEGGGVLVATATRDEAKIGALRAKGADVVVLPDVEGKVDLSQMVRHLAGIGLNEVLVESGINLNSALLRAGVVDELLLYYAPHMLGDAGRGMLDLESALDGACSSRSGCRMFGPDMRILLRLSA
jgi:diaminohydroxyphosphoribosylaminopyrimidine deaminase/5-amino-6-(5-phosphoribosylamino)uracil reductase